MNLKRSRPHLNRFMNDKKTVEINHTKQSTDCSTDELNNKYCSQLELPRITPI